MGNLKSSPSLLSSEKSLLPSSLLSLLIEEISKIKIEDVLIAFRKYEDNIGIHVYYLSFDQFNEIFIQLFGSKCQYYFNMFKNSDNATVAINPNEEYEEYGNT